MLAYKIKNRLEIIAANHGHVINDSRLTVVMVNFRPSVIKLTITVDNRELIEDQSTTVEDLLDYIEQKMRKLPKCFHLTDDDYRKIARKCIESIDGRILYETDRNDLHLIVEGDIDRLDAFAADVENETEIATDFDSDTLYAFIDRFNRKDDESQAVSMHTLDILKRCN